MPIISDASQPPAAPLRVVEDGYLSREEAAAYLRISKAHLAVLACRGGGPVFVKFSKRMVRYRRCDLDEWAASRLCRSTSAATVREEAA